MADLARHCPPASPGDQAAFDACRTALFGASPLRQALSEFTLWGHQHRDPSTPLKETNLTQFGPDVLAGLYVPLFMFSGQHALAWSENEQKWRVELAAGFRNRLQPTQFPYPFWHEEEKWAAYERANAMLLWLEPGGRRIEIIQFTDRGPPTQIVRTEPRDIKFDGQWMWTDAAGRTQPKVTLFDGLFRAENPHLVRLDASYRDLALSLRESQCMGCHVPSNPEKIKRLVLLQTPAHAAAEIHRVMRAVRRDSMPLDRQTGIAAPLDPDSKDRLLARAAEFEAAVLEARTWEAARGGSQQPTGPPRPEPANVNSEDPRRTR